MCDERDRRIGSMLAERDEQIARKIDKAFDSVTAQIQHGQGVSPPSVNRTSVDTEQRLQLVEASLKELEWKV